MGFYACKECEAIIIGESTVGMLLAEGESLHKEGLRRDQNKMIQALNKYQEAWTVLKANNGHEECLRRVDDEYYKLYRSLQGSRT